MSFFFISYQHDSQSFARDLRRRIRDAGLLDWMDEDIQAGEEWKIEIDTAIKGSIAVIAVITLKALQSQFVTYEWSFALGLGKRVIPIILEMPDIRNPEHPKLHPKLDERQYRDFSDSDKQSVAWEKLIEELKTFQSKEDIPLAVRNAENILIHHDRNERLNAVATLKDYDHPSAFDALARAINSPFSEVAIEAALALAEKSHYQDEKALPGLELALQKRDNVNDRISRSIETLGKFDIHSVVSVLLRILDNIPADYDFGIREKIASTFTEISDPIIVPVLIKIVGNIPRKQNLRVLQALRDFRDKRAVPALIQLLKPDELSIVFVIDVIGKLGDPIVLVPLFEFLQTYISVYKGSDEKIVNACLGVFQEIGTETALQLLEKSRTDGNFRQWRSAIASTIFNIRGGI